MWGVAFWSMARELSVAWVLEGTVCLVQTVCDVAETGHAKKASLK
jgi:hypothetical protein